MSKNPALEKKNIKKNLESRKIPTTKKKSPF